MARSSAGKVAGKKPSEENGMNGALESRGRLARSANACGRNDDAGTRKFKPGADGDAHDESGGRALSPNRNDLKVFSLVTGAAVGGPVLLCPQLLKVAAQGRLPGGVERRECAIRG